MSVESLVSEAKSNLDKLIPPLEDQRYHQVNVTIPTPQITLEYMKPEFSLFELIASISMAVGFMLLGAMIHGILR